MEWNIEFIEKAIIKAKLNQRQLAQELGNDPRTVSLWLSGKQKPNRNNQNKIMEWAAAVLNTEKKADFQLLKFNIDDIKKIVDLKFNY